MLSGEASILKLVDSHPVIDSILYCPKTKNIYFLQTSKSKYDRHIKKIDNLQDVFGKTTVITIPSEIKTSKIETHYKNKLVLQIPILYTAHVLRQNLQIQGCLF